ncbi:ETX/MTX2 family pore-forming toxin [Mesoplasma melaleucae]|uniref:ETX/MTX2 family pore-forming toxin n=1 Tax=Mesoplasma melaleucae TaxID=81459 RepID=UPI003A5C799F
MTFQFSSTTTRTDTTQTTLTALSQLVKVSAHSAMSVTYNVYQQHKIYDELIIGKLNPIQWFMLNSAIIFQYYQVINVLIQWMIQF